MNSVFELTRLVKAFSASLRLKKTYGELTVQEDKLLGKLSDNTNGSGTYVLSVLSVMSVLFLNNIK